MPAPTVTIPTTGTDPKYTTKAAAETAINAALSLVWDEAQSAKARGNHSGTQAAATIIDKDVELLARDKHSGTQSADTVVDGTSNKVLSAAKKTDIDQISYRVDGDGLIVTFGDRDVMKVDAAGNLSAMLGPERLERGWDRLTPPGNIPPGVREAAFRMGQYWQYRVNGERILVVDNVPNFTPALLDTTCFRALMINGQSWMTQTEFTAELDREDPSGGTRRRLERLRTVDYVTTRSDTIYSPAVPAKNGYIRRRAGSTDTGTYFSGPVTGLRYFRPGVLLGVDGGVDVIDYFNIGDIAASSLQYFLRLLGGDVLGLIGLQCGRAGTDSPYFEKAGPPIDGNTSNMFTNDTKAINEVKALVKSDYFDKPLFWDAEIYGQGGADGTQTTPGEYLTHLNQRRADIDSRGLLTSDGGKIWLFAMICWAAGHEVDQGYQPLDQCDWAIANASGRDVAVGPFNHLKLEQESGDQSVIHQTAMSAVLIGEQFGLAMAHCLTAAIGGWDQFRITNVVHDAGNHRFVVTVPTHSAAGAMQINTTTIEAADGYGFTVKKGSNNAKVPVVTTVVNDTTLHVTYTTGALTGETTVLFDYMGFGVSQPDVAIGEGSHSACWGNIMRLGLYTGPISHRPTDIWLWPRRIAALTL